MRVFRCPDSPTGGLKAELNSVKNVQQRLLWASAFCRNAQMRLTPVRQAILSFLAQQRVPATLGMISMADGVRGQCDMTTVYRTLMMFKEAGLIRLVGTPRKASCYVLNVPGDLVHFLICHHCGCVAELPLPATVSAELERIVSAQGFSPKAQDYEIHGLCGNCHSALKTQVAPSKLIVSAARKAPSSKRAVTS
jgi:Fur family zinc uptake transcriptional regulator